MGFARVINNRLGEQYYVNEHPSGLKIVVVPMEGYSSAYAIFGTKYGSIDDCFKRSDEENFSRVPAGIAHFLEHKLFENEDCDAFEQYAKTGASANAYTSFDKTCYLFSCTDKLKESLEILLNFVQAPYFTPETVQKEQGIIGQEIKMYDDSPEWRVYFNLLGALYPKHPVRIDIAGTVDSIAKIDDKLLYKCYNTFYNLHNMVLVVAGNVNPDDVIEVADKTLKNADMIKIKRCLPQEPLSVGKDYVEQKFPVPTPLFMLGFKESASPNEPCTGEDIAETEILLEIIAGTASPLYAELTDEGLINNSFGSEYFTGPGYRAELFSAESKDPFAVRDRIVAEIENLRENGIPENRFEAAKRLIYGGYIGGLTTAESIANSVVADVFENRGLYDCIEAAANVTIEKLTCRLDRTFSKERMSLSVVQDK